MIPTVAVAVAVAVVVVVVTILLILNLDGVELGLGTLRRDVGRPCDGRWRKTARYRWCAYPVSSDACTANVLAVILTIVQ